MTLSLSLSRLSSLSLAFVAVEALARQTTIGLLALRVRQTSKIAWVGNSRVELDLVLTLDHDRQSLEANPTVLDGIVVDRGRRYAISPV